MPPRAPIRLSQSHLCRPARQWQQRVTIARVSQRGFADERPIAERPLENRPGSEKEQKGPNMDQLPHISEEAAATKQSMGEQGPDVEHGKPVSEVLKGDKKAQEHLPKVMKDQLKKQEEAAGSQKRSFSTYARPPQRFSAKSRSDFSRGRAFSTSLRRRLALEDGQPPRDTAEEGALQSVGGATSVQQVGSSALAQAEERGLKFGAPAKLAAQGHLRKRYEPIVDQVTKLMMHDGKLSQAQRHMQAALNHLRTAPAPKRSSVILVRDAPPNEVLPLNPTVYLQVAIDSIAPLIRMRSLKGLAGGGVALQVPEALNQRQRRRTAIMWMLELVEKKKGSTSPYGKRFAEECVAVVEGRSVIWDRRGALHALGMRSRANIAAAARKRAMMKGRN